MRRTLIIHHINRRYNLVWPQIIQKIFQLVIIAQIKQPWQWPCPGWRHITHGGVTQFPFALNGIKISLRHLTAAHNQHMLLVITQLPVTAQ